MQSQPNPNPIEILTQSILVTWSFILIFFLCQCGQFVTNQFDYFDDKLYQCNWHLFPIEIQRMLVIVMTNTQRPSTVHGFANTFCTRDAFKGVKFRVTWEEIATIHVLLIFLRAFVDRSGRILLFYDDASNWWQSSWIGYGFEFFRMRQPSHEWLKQCLGKSLLAMKRNPKNSN